MTCALITVHNSGIHHRFFGIGFLLQNVHSQLQYLIAIGRIDGGIQHTVSTSSSRFPYPARHLCCTKIIPSPLPCHLCCLIGTGAILVTGHTQHQSWDASEAYYPFLSLPDPRSNAASALSIGFISGNLLMAAHKSLMLFHCRRPNIPILSVYYISFPLDWRQYGFLPNDRFHNYRLI